MAVRHIHKAGCAMCNRIAIPECKDGGEIMARSRRRKVFISYHHLEGQEYKDRFV